MALLAAGAAVAAAAIPVRHWFQSREPVQSIVKAPPSDSVPVAPKPRPSTRISFVLAGDELTIRLDSLPSSGYLTVDRTTTSQVSLAPEGADGTADSTAVLPNEIRLYDKRGAALRYRLTIPTRAVRLRVVVQGDTTFNGPPSGRIPLAEMR